MCCVGCWRYPQMKLNARQVGTAKPEEKPYKLADGGGLYLLVNPNGSRYWRLKYRVAGKEKLLALGVYPKQFFYHCFLFRCDHINHCFYCFIPGQRAGA